MVCHYLGRSLRPANVPASVEAFCGTVVLMPHWSCRKPGEVSWTPIEVDCGRCKASLDRIVPRHYQRHRVELFQWTPADNWQCIIFVPKEKLRIWWNGIQERKVLGFGKVGSWDDFIGLASPV